MSADLGGYDVEVWRTESGFAARHPSLPGVRGYGRTEGQALQDLAAARVRFLACCAERGWEVPLPDGGAEVRRT